MARKHYDLAATYNIRQFYVLKQIKLHILGSGYLVVVVQRFLLEKSDPAS